MMMPLENTQTTTSGGTSAAFEAAQAKHEQVQLHERREKLAAAALSGMLANPEHAGSHAEYADDAVRYAEALIRRLDRSVEDAP